MGAHRSLGIRALLRGALIVASIGLALHLVLPQIPGLERSGRLLANASPVVVALAFAAEVLSELCYARLLQSCVSGTRLTAAGRTVARRTPNLWFFLRLTFAGYGAAHVLPGGGAAASAIDYRALRARGYETAHVARTLTVVAALVYSALGLLFAFSLVYLLVDRKLSGWSTAGAVALLILPLIVALLAYAARKSRWSADGALGALTNGVPRLLRRGHDRREARARLRRLLGGIAGEYRALRAELHSAPRRAARLFSLAVGFWAFDALCMVLVFAALGVQANLLSLLVAYGVATVAGTLPFTPGGIGVFETTMLAALALLGAGSGAAIAILGYRLFNFWMPIPLAAILYPTLGYGSRRTDRGLE